MRNWQRLGAALALLLAVLASTPSDAATYQTDADESFGPPGLGVILTSSGLVLPVREVHDDGYVVATPCWNEAFVDSGFHVPRADVVLDPGHGGSDTGAVGANGLVERDLNVTVAELVRTELEARGYTVVLTRTTNVRLPILTRAEIAHALAPKALVSIHHNGGAKSRSPDPGTETFHQANNPDSTRLAGILFEEVHAALSQYDVAWVATSNKGATGVLRARDGRDLYGILRYPETVPTAIVEPVYLSNPAEARLLADPAVQAVEARAIATGIVRFIATDDAGSGHNGVFTSARVLTSGGRGGCVDPVLDSDVSYTSRYNDTEWAFISSAASTRGETVATFQRSSVRILAYLLGVTGTEPQPIVARLHPSNTGANSVTTVWDPDERALLAGLAQGFGMSNEVAQKLVTLGVAYMLSLG